MIFRTDYYRIGANPFATIDKQKVGTTLGTPARATKNNSAGFVRGRLHLAIAGTP